MRHPQERKSSSGSCDKAAAEPPSVFGRMFEHHQCGAAPFTTEPDPLDDPQRDQKNGRPDADLLVGGQQADGESAQAHDDQRDEEHRLAAQLVAEKAEECATEGPGEEADGGAAKGGQRAQEGVIGGEEQFVEDQRRGGAVDEEVIPLDDGAYRAGEDDSIDLGSMGTGRLGFALGRCGVAHIGFLCVISLSSWDRGLTKDALTKRRVKLRPAASSGCLQRRGTLGRGSAPDLRDHLHRRLDKVSVRAAVSGRRGLERCWHGLAPSKDVG
jgi:hypothetical protein